ncbi:ribonuclease P protein subunit p30, putative [Ixodes scapularis]|uniref:Ribonuclease P protein subunit p30, putative n=1 Tax=Ixodes scapularis TaxID=6945 RepID=B7Q5Z4_IXOSC|nr:ribonuclease P protein subunit p30, putative [Ixodes scapularis]|eukprot:XP_002411846.1 ribonuclease P protein subunit p30, putative [Ixodes scapularis]
MDLNILVQRESEKLDKGTVIGKIRAAFKLGYNVVALNVVVGSQELGTKNKIPEPPCYSLGPEDLSASRGRKLRILTRLTAVLSDSGQSHRLQLCNQGDLDILSLPLDTKLPFLVKRAQYGAAIGRGVMFEVQYAPCLRDKAPLRNTLANCQNLLHAGQGKAQELRGPNDAANVGFLFGLSECTARDAVYGNCKSVIVHAETRSKVSRAIIFSQPTDEVSARDRWLLESCKLPESQDTVPSEPPRKKKKCEGT